MAAVAALAALAAGCTRPGGADVYGTDCKPREIRRVESDGTLTAALARQAAENRTYRDCLERRSVRVAR
jgi:hypothetical protein